MTTWVLDIEEFAALWFRPASDRMLHPIHYLSRFTHVNALSEYRNQVSHQWSERGRLDRDSVELLQRALDVLTWPEVWLELHGRSEFGPLRAVGARHAQHAAIARQSADGALLRLTVGPAGQLAPRLAQILPDASAGERPPQRMTLAHPAEPEPVAVTHIDRYDQRVDLNRMRTEPTTSSGVIHTFLGPRDNRGQRPERVGTLEWYDRADGRYLERVTTVRNIVPGDQAAVTRSLQRDIDQAYALRDNDQEAQ